MISISSSTWGYQDWFFKLVNECNLEIGKDFVWGWDHDDNGHAVIHFHDNQTELLVRLKYSENIDPDYDCQLRFNFDEKSKS